MIGKGTGLGLSMVHGLAAQLGCALTIQSQEEAGTTVELWLPVSALIAIVDDATTSGSAEPAGRGLVLLVDDEDVVRASATDMLEEFGSWFGERRDVAPAWRCCRIARTRGGLSDLRL